MTRQRVTINELVIAVNMALDMLPIDRCPTLDANGDQAVTIR